MRKFTGKAVSLVLALALVVSSFSGTFAFAAKKTVNAYDVSFDNDDDIALVKDSGYTDLLNKIGTITLKYVDGREKKTEDITGTDDDQKVTMRHTSGDSLLSFKSEGSEGRPTFRAKKDTTGTEKVRIYAEAKTDLGDGTTAVVKGYKDLTIKVISTDDRFVAINVGDKPQKLDKGALTDLEPAKDLPGDIELPVNDDAEHDVAIFRAEATAVGNNATPKYVVADTDKDGNTIIIDGNDDGNSKVGLISADSGYKKNNNDEFQKVTKIQNKGAMHGSLKLDVKSLKEKDSTNHIYKFDKTVDSTTVSILKAVTLNGTATSVDVTKDGGRVKIPAEAMAGIYASRIKDSNLSGYTFYGTGSNTVNFKEGVSVGDVKNFANVDVSDKAKVGDIKDVSTKVTIADENSVVGNIDIDGIVSLTEGRVAKIEAKGIDISGGTVTGDVKAKDDTNVTINASNDDVNTVIGGTVEAQSVDIKCDTDDATVTINAIKLKNDSAELTLNGDRVTIKSINADYEGDVKFEDFQGTIGSLVQPDEISATEDTKAVIKGDVVASSLDIDEDGYLEFAGALTVDSVSGDGKLVVPADKFMINEDASSNLILKLSGNDVKVGDVAYRAKKDASVDTDSFKGYGFDVEKKNENKNTDSYLVKNVTFAGVALDKTAIEIAKDYSNTVTVSNYPASTSLPAGAKIVWDYSDADKDVFAVTENGNTVTIKAVGFDTKYATSNEFDLTATVVDANGDEIKDYDAATCKVTAVAEPKVSCDLSGIVEVPQGSIKNFTLSSPALVTPALGNGAVAVTGTVKAYADGKATYAVKAIGAVGTTTGVYAHVGAFNKQVFTMKVVAPKVTVDTTMNFALAKGNRYVYKVTAPTRPAFTVGNGAVIKTQYAKVVGNDYYFIVYAVGNAGQSTGVYVNGVKVNAITVK